MKPDIERKRYFSAKMHQKKKNMDVHLSKELRGRMKRKKRAIGVRKGDKVKIMRGQHSGKEAKVVKVSVADRLVFLEGFTRKTARGKELSIPFQPSNLMLISLAESKERSSLFGSEIFKQKETGKKQKEAGSEGKATKSAEEKSEGGEERLSKTGSAG